MLIVLVRPFAGLAEVCVFRKNGARARVARLLYLSAVRSGSCHTHARPCSL